jgi:hypothetical protein
MLQPQFWAIFREPAGFSVCTAFVSTYLVKVLHIFIHSWNMTYPKLHSGTISFEEKLNTYFDTTNYLSVYLM